MIRYPYKLSTSFLAVSLILCSCGVLSSNHTFKLTSELNGLRGFRSDGGYVDQTIFHIGGENTFVWESGDYKLEFFANDHTHKNLAMCLYVIPLVPFFSKGAIDLSEIRVTNKSESDTIVVLGLFDKNGKSPDSVLISKGRYPSIRDTKYYMYALSNGNTLKIAPNEQYWIMTNERSTQTIRILAGKKYDFKFDENHYIQWYYLTV